MRYEKNISQSFLKSYIEYAEGRECGLRFRAIFIDKTLSIYPSDAMELGRYFEFCATGYVREGDEEPKPKLKRDGAMTIEYQRATEQAQNFKDDCAALGIEIVSVGERIEKDNLSLVLDVRAMYEGREVIIDLKHTGLLYNKWEDNGWSLDGFEFKTKHHHQPIHYMFMTGLPFYYFVFSSTNETDREFFEVVVPQPDTNELHARRIDRIRNRIGIELATGFIPRPDLKRCLECELFANCKSRQEAPTPKRVDIAPVYNQILDEE
jgi:hypothetical protein